MKKVFLGLLLGVNVLSFSQIPYDYLKAFYPFTDSARDESGNLHHGVTKGTLAAQDRFQIDSSALELSGYESFVALPGDFDSPARTISFWFNASDITEYQKLYCSDHANIEFGSTNIDLHQDIMGNNILRFECGGAV